MCFQYEDMDGFMVPKKSVPQPKAYTIGDAIDFSRNTFSVLGESQSSKRFVAKAKCSTSTAVSTKPRQVFPGSTWDQSVTDTGITTTSHPEAVRENHQKTAAGPRTQDVPAEMLESTRDTDRETKKTSSISYSEALELSD